MFTGIVELVGKIVETRAVSGGGRLRVHVGPIAAECALGASVSISGVCLTVAERAANHLEFDVVRETLNKSTLGRKAPGDGVNVERSLRVGDRLDGHLVQGHVDGIAKVERVQASAHEYVVWLRCSPQLDPYLIPKGSVALDGVSLTIASLSDGSFSVALIPATLERTTLGRLRAGDEVNLETDVMVRAIVHRVDETIGARGLSMDALKVAGFA